MFRLLGHSLSTEVIMSPSGQYSSIDGLSPHSSTSSSRHPSSKATTPLVQRQQLEASPTAAGGSSSLDEARRAQAHRPGGSDFPYIPDEVDDDDELHVDEQDVAALQRSLKRSQLLLDEMCSKASVAKAALEDREVQVTELQTERERQQRAMTHLEETQKELLGVVEEYQKREGKLLTVLRMLTLTVMGVCLIAITTLITSSSLFITDDETRHDL